MALAATAFPRPSLLEASCGFPLASRESGSFSPRRNAHAGGTPVDSQWGGADKGLFKPEGW